MANYGSPFIISNFLRKRFLKENNTRVIGKAFTPRYIERTAREELSCFEIQRLTKAEIKEIVVRNEIRPNGKYPLAYCFIHEFRFDFENLEIEFDDVPPRHCNIIGWELDSEMTKRVNIEKLAEIASENIELLDF